MAEITQEQIALIAFGMSALNLSRLSRDPDRLQIGQETFKTLYFTTVSNALGIKAGEVPDIFRCKIYINSEKLMTGHSEFHGLAYGSEQHIRQHLISCYPGIELCPEIKILNQNGTNQNRANDAQLIMSIMLSLAGVGLAITAIAVFLSVPAAVAVPSAIGAIGLIGIFGGAALIANQLGNLNESLNTSFR